MRNLRIYLYKGIQAVEEMRTSFFPRPETNFIRNSIRYRGAIAWNSLTNKETTAKTLKDFKRCLRKFDTDEMNFEPMLAITKNRIPGYKYF